MAAVAWGYTDRKKGKSYYTESYAMSVTDFAGEVNDLVGGSTTLTAADMSKYDKKDKIPKGAIHIAPRKSIYDK